MPVADSGSSLRHDLSPVLAPRVMRNTCSDVDHAHGHTPREPILLHDNQLQSQVLDICRLGTQIESESFVEDGCRDYLLGARFPLLYSSSFVEEPDLYVDICTAREREREREREISKNLTQLAVCKCR